MSAPGNLPPSELLPVGADQMLDVAALWFYQADEALLAAFGFRMVIKTPYGAYRTCADQAAINPSLPCSSSDHTKGRAIDVDNQGRFRSINAALFVQLLADNGFYNEQVNGAPFPDEPWHFRNMLAAPPAPPPAPELPEEDEMSLRGLTYWKVSDGDGTNWLVPDDLGWRIITEDSAGSGQGEVNGVTAALGYGPATVSRAEFNARAAERIPPAGLTALSRPWVIALIITAVIVAAVGVVVIILAAVGVTPAAPLALTAGAFNIFAGVLAGVVVGLHRVRRRPGD